MGGDVSTRFTPYGWRTARSRHPGGVNVAFADASVHFIQDEGFDLIKMDVSLLHQVQQTPGSGYENINTATQRLYLSCLIDTAENSGVLQLQKPAVIANAVPDLGGKFPGGCHDQSPGSSLGRLTRQSLEMIQQGQSKRCRFSRTGLGGSDNIATGKNMIDALFLNGGGDLITGSAHRFLNGRYQMGEAALQSW
jgi:prepilin-type processing-associated H-X9-DG protein